MGVDATTLEAKAALRTLVKRDDGQSYKDYIVELARAEGIENPLPMRTSLAEFAVSDNLQFSVTQAWVCWGSGGARKTRQQTVSSPSADKTPSHLP